MPDITQLILDDHAWFRQQFATLDDLQAQSPLDVDAVRRVWDPLAALPAPWSRPPRWP